MISWKVSRQLAGNSPSRSSKSHESFAWLGCRKILIDECVDQRIRFLFAERDCQTAAYAELAGLKNGALLTLVEADGFQVIITTDQEIPYQQNLSGRQISVVVLCAPTNRLADLRPFVPAAMEALDSIRPGRYKRLTRPPDTES